MKWSLRHPKNYRCLGGGDTVNYKHVGQPGKSFWLSFCNHWFWCLVSFHVFVLWAERPEAVTGKYPFLGVVLVNRILNYSNTPVRQISSFNYVPIFKSIQMVYPVKKCLFSPWGALTNPETSVLWPLGIDGLEIPRFLSQTLCASGSQHPDTTRSLVALTPERLGLWNWGLG